MGNLSCGWTRPSSGHWAESQEADEGEQQRTAQKCRRLLGRAEEQPPGKRQGAEEEASSERPCPPEGVHRPPGCLASEGQWYPSLGTSKDSHFKLPVS